MGARRKAKRYEILFAISALLPIFDADDNVPPPILAFLFLAFLRAPFVIFVPLKGVLK